MNSLQRTFFLLAVISMPGWLFAQFTGGAGDGYAQNQFNAVGTLYAGSEGDGFAVNVIINASSIFTGTPADGHDLSEYNDSGSIARGGGEDGFDVSAYLHYHKWTGAVGSGWLIAGNWESNIIPGDTMRVCIPATAANMPFINSGIFKIGTAIGANFTCKELWVQSGATLTGRVNAFIENHSTILVDGLLRWRNPAPNSLLIEPGAQLRVRNGGVLMTDF